MSQHIKLGISPDIFELVPGYRRATVVAIGLKNGPSDKALQELLGREIEAVRQKLAVDEPQLIAWREAFQQVGIKPKKFRPSIDALVRRILNGGVVPSISTVVDIGSLLSLRHMLPCGAHSLNDVRRELVLRPAAGSEQFTAFGTDESEPVARGEIIFTDGDAVATRQWAWRQGEHTIIRPSTTAFELNIDALAGVADQELKAIIADACDVIKEFLGVEPTVYQLNKEVPFAWLAP